MKITYLGHSSFLMTESTDISVVTDPYNHIGYDLPTVQANAVTISHHKYDHSNVQAVKGDPLIIDKEGVYELDGVQITAIKSIPENVKFSKHGDNLICKYRMDGLDICHLGDLSESCSAELLEQILPIDILMIPVGGKHSLSAEQAKEYVDRIMPEIVIPMHYKTKDLKMDLDKLDEFIDLFEDEEVEYSNDDTIELFRDDLSGENTKVIVMERLKD